MDAAMTKFDMRAPILGKSRAGASSTDVGFMSRRYYWVVAAAETTVAGVSEELLFGFPLAS